MNGENGVNKPIKTVEPHILNSLYWQSIEWANGVMETVIRKNKQS